jgi:hypothetical protein
MGFVCCICSSLDRLVWSSVLVARFGRLLVELCGLTMKILDFKVFFYKMCRATLLLNKYTRDYSMCVKEKGL